MANASELKHLSQRRKTEQAIAKIATQIQKLSNAITVWAAEVEQRLDAVEGLVSAHSVALVEGLAFTKRRRSAQLKQARVDIQQQRATLHAVRCAAEGLRELGRSLEGDDATAEQPEPPAATEQRARG